MTRKLLAALMSLAMAGGLALADDQTVREKAEELVSQLGSDDAAVREKATEELSKLGPEAIPVLEEASRSKDPEVQWRAEKAIAKIKESAEPQTQPQEDEDRPKQTRRPGGFSSSIRIQIGGPGSVSIQRDGSGHVKVTVTEKDEKGEKVSKSYEADSAAEFKEKYPDVAKKYGIDDEGTAPQVVMPPGMEDLDELLKDPLAGFQEMLKRLQQGGGIVPGPRKPRPPEPPAPVPLESEPVQPPEAPQGEAATPDDFGAEVSFIDEALRDQLDLTGDEGVIVRDVVLDSPAAKAGLERHDVVLSVNGEPVKTKWDFRRLLIEGSSSGKVELAIVRQGEPRTLSVDPALLRK